MDPHRIVDVRLYEAHSKLAKPIADATHQIPTIRFIVTEVQLAGGVSGEGYLLAFHYSPQAIVGALRDIAGHFTVGGASA